MFRAQGKNTSPAQENIQAGCPWKKKKKDWDCWHTLAVEAGQRWTPESRAGPAVFLELPLEPQLHDVWGQVWNLGDECLRQRPARSVCLEAQQDQAQNRRVWVLIIINDLTH